VISRARIAAVLASVMLAALATAATAAGAVPTSSVTVTSPNGAAKVRGTIYWYDNNHWEFRGWLSDTACNSHDVWVDIWKNRRYSWEKFEGTWTFWGGSTIVRSWRNSDGCGTSTIVSMVHKDANYNNHDVDFQVCDNGWTDSCNSSKWPNEWYGAYNNPY
jgi:opacity protein-like surface antigen